MAFGVNILPASTGAIIIMGLIPESGRSSGENMEIHSIILAWRICWTEEPGGLQTMGSQKDMTEVT